MGNESPPTSRRAQRGAGVLCLVVGVVLGVVFAVSQGERVLVYLAIALLFAGVALLISGRRSVPAD